MPVMRSRRLYEWNARERWSKIAFWEKDNVAMCDEVTGIKAVERGEQSNKI